MSTKIWKKLFINILKAGHKFKSYFGLLVFKEPIGKKTCRFKVRCSEYTYKAIEECGIIKGGFAGVRRILSCNMWSKKI